MENFFHLSRYYTTTRVTAIVFKALHSVSFPCACLPVGQYCRIVAFKDRLHCRLRCGLIDGLLGAVLVVDIVEAVALPDAQMWV